MEFSHDEVRRGLADAKAAQAEALPAGARRCRGSSTRRPATRPTPSGRCWVCPTATAFLRVGGVTIAMSAVVAACGKKKADPIPFTGTSPTSSASTGIEQIGQELDVTLLRTSQSVEVLAVQTYQKALDSGIVTTQSLIDTIKLFQEQHDGHSGLIAATTTRRGR